MTELIQIAICDDEKESVALHEDIVRSSLQSCSIGYEIAAYTQSSNLLFDIVDDNLFYDLILLDIEMPGITGMELSEKISQELVIFALIMIASLLLSTLRLLMTDAYVFYRPVSAKLLINRTGKTGSVLLYLLRYLITNKNYLLNTAGLCVNAAFLPFIFGQFEGLNVIPLGFAILCLNTPICILLSCDRSLEQAIRVLPGQASRFCTRYCLFIFLVNMAVSSVYLVSRQIRHGGVSGIEISPALIIALQSAILSVLLEWLRPIRNWKIENDLLHHPRKYLVPLIMLLIAVLISVWSLDSWIWLCIILAEVIGLSLTVRRI